MLCRQLVGGTLIGLGGWSFLEEYDHTFLKVQNILDIILHISVALMTVGAIIFSMSFAGCLGALRENLFLLKLVFIAYFCIVYSDCKLIITFMSLCPIVFITPSIAVRRRSHTIDRCVCFSQFLLILSEGKPFKGSNHQI